MFSVFGATFFCTSCQHHAIREFLIGPTESTARRYSRFPYTLSPSKSTKILFDCAQAVIVHECTGGFLRWVLTTFLPEWDWHCLVKDGSSPVPSAKVNDTDTDAFLLSPHMVGWPLNRPRLFEVGTLRGTCYLEPPCEADSCSEVPGESGFAAIGELFQPCKLDCSALMVAHQDSWLKYL